MKTPEEIATGLMRSLSENPKDWDFHALIVRGIEDDQAQRQARLDDLHAYDWEHIANNGLDSEDYESALIVQIDAPSDIGRIRVYINDGRIYDGDPETGEEWSLT